MQSYHDWTLMIVDDEPDTLRLIQDYMTLIGIETYAAENGYAALEMLKSVRPDCVLMDIAMPGINGIETLQAIRANPAIAQLPVIALTANVGKVDKPMLMDCGFNGFISKPFDLQMLVRDIQGCLEKHRTAA